MTDEYVWSKKDEYQEKSQRNAVTKMFVLNFFPCLKCIKKYFKLLMEMGY